MERIRSQEALQAAIRKNQILILQFGSENCAPCKALQNRIEAWNQEHSSICYAYVSLSDLSELCAQMGVFTVPAIFVYVEGRMTIERSGYFSLEQMLARIEKYEELLAEQKKDVR